MKEALKLALEALNWSTPHEGAVITHGEAITAIKAALAQPAQQEPVDFTSLLREAEEIVQSKPTWKRFIDGTPLSNDIAVWMAVFAQDVARRNASQPAQQEPVAWMREDGTLRFAEGKVFAVNQPFYTPPQRAWAGLTEARIKEIWLNGKDYGNDWLDVFALARAFEAELKELNT